MSLGRIMPKDMITHRFSIDDIHQAMKTFVERIDGALKVGSSRDPQVLALLPRPAPRRPVRPGLPPLQELSFIEIGGNEVDESELANSGMICRKCRYLTWMRSGDVGVGHVGGSLSIGMPWCPVPPAHAGRSTRSPKGGTGPVRPVQGTCGTRSVCRPGEQGVF